MPDPVGGPPGVPRVAVKEEKSKATAPLTPRQLETLDLIAQGLTNAEICSELRISPNTVKAHVAAILKSLDVTNRTEAALVHQQNRSGAHLGLAPKPPAIAVLPFQNLSSAPDQEYFVDGLVEDLITRLSAWRLLPVISRNSTFAFRSRGLEDRSIAAELGARYLVHGSVRRAGERIRTTARLVDAQCGHQLWAECYDSNLQDVFKAQDELASKIVTSLECEILESEKQRVAVEILGEPGAWERTARGLWHAHRRTPQDLERALACFAEALSGDPAFCPAWIGLARAHYVRVFERCSPDTEADLRHVEQAAEQALRLDPRNALSHFAAGLARMMQGRPADAIAHLQTAVELNPSSTEALGFLGQLRAGAGEIEVGMAHLHEAIRLNPRDPYCWSHTWSLALCHLALDESEAAVEWARRSVRLNPDRAYGHAALAWSLALSGATEEAAESWAKFHQIWPEGFVREHFDRLTTSWDPDTTARFLARLFEGMRIMEEQARQTGPRPPPE
jgi:TolB-like protein/cytochrome c-type biogenesis protein CcmH/NrfG